MTSTSWQISEDFPHFAEKTALICMSHRSAKVYVAEQRDLREEAAMETAETDFHYSDKEGMSFTRGGGIGSAPGTDGHNEEHYDQVFLNYFVEELSKRIRAESWQKIILFLPADMKGLVTKKIPNEYADRCEFQEGNLVNSHPFELLKRLSKI